jgi:ubiquinone/menaquinone biosynthesis C-methylase UbiE
MEGPKRCSNVNTFLSSVLTFQYSVITDILSINEINSTQWDLDTVDHPGKISKSEPCYISMTNETTPAYVHGYSERETERLYDQAGSVRNLVHQGTSYPPGSKVLEAGCGVGAQTVTLAQNSPEARFYSVDWAEKSLSLARNVVQSSGISNVEFLQADIFDLPYEEEFFDHLFVCHLLEHLLEPVTGLSALRTHVKIGGSLTVFEGDHGSCYFHPQSKEASMAWNCLVEVQRRLGANSLIGRELYPLINDSGFRDVRITPKMVYIDQSLPKLMDSFVSKTIIPMVEGVKVPALGLGLIDEKSWHKGIDDLHQITRLEKGTFCYTFFKGEACN